LFSVAPNGNTMLIRQWKRVLASQLTLTTSDRDELLLTLSMPLLPVHAVVVLDVLPHGELSVSHWRVGQGRIVGPPHLSDGWLTLPVLRKGKVEIEDVERGKLVPKLEFPGNEWW
jgi:hypothetical protein